MLIPTRKYLERKIIDLEFERDSFMLTYASDRAAKQRIRDLHHACDCSDCDCSACAHCEYPMPCPTIQALDGKQ